jgi:hypothetical protein
MGRPVEFNQGIVDQAREYIEDYASHGHAIPSVVGLCSVLNRARSTLYKWAEDESTGFSDILEAINEKQQLVLLSKGLTDEFNASITKLVLGKHGYHDKQDTELTGKGGDPLSIAVSFIDGGS